MQALKLHTAFTGDYASQGSASAELLKQTLFCFQHMYCMIQTHALVHVSYYFKIYYGMENSSSF